MADDKFWKTVLAVMVGALLAGVIGYGLRMWMISQALSEMQRTISAATGQMQESARRAALQQQQAQAQRARMAQEAVERKQQEVAEQQRGLEEARHAAQMYAKAKEDAWNRYYRKPAYCDKAEGPAFVECANNYIRAKKAFEDLYAAGKL